jgi:hydrogenase-4 component B
MFLAGAVAICGLPPLNGFVSEWVIYGSLFSGLLGGSHAAVSALGILSLALMGGLALACFVKVYGVVFLGRPRDASMVVHPASATMILGMAPLAASCVAIGLAAGQWVELARPAAGDLAGASAEGLAPDLANLLAWLSRVSVFGLVFIAVTAALIVLRSILRTRKALRDAAQPPAGLDTWACGYSHTTARMQYSATSFAMPIVTSFRGLLWPERSGDTTKGMFPERRHVELHVVDLADHDIFRPLFRGAERVFAMIRTVSWSGSVQPGRPTRLVVQQSRRPLRNLLSRMVVTLRRGAIHVHLTLIVVTLLLVLTIEGFSQRRSVDRTTVQTQDSAISGGIRP